MKRFLFLLSLFTSFLTSYSQTNIYHPLPDSGYYWKSIDLRAECYTGFSDTTQAYFLYYTILGDTIVDSKTYKKVWGLNSLYEFIYFRGYLRDDSINRKIYMVTDDPDDYTITGDTLLYDFNLEIGSSVAHFYEFWNFPIDFPSNSIVFAVDSIEIEETYRRRIGIQYELWQCDKEDPLKIDTLYWIEGIGSTIGLTSPQVLPLNAQGEHVADVLTCVYKMDIPIFTNEHSWHTCDEIFLPGISINDITFNPISSINPQPADNFLIINFNNNNTINSICIYDLLGRPFKVLEYEGMDSLYLVTSDFPSGIYILTINDSQLNIFSQQIIIQH